MEVPYADLDVAGIAASVQRVRTRIADAAERSGRMRDDVTVLAATKYLDAQGCSLLVDAGITDLAENRLDALSAKQDQLGTDGALGAVAWHFIGRLQSRQAAEIASRARAIHTLCSHSAAGRLASRGADQPQLLVQVNVDADPAKDGIEPDGVERFLHELPEPLRVTGLMTMPAWAADPEHSRAAFAALRTLRDRLAPLVVGRHELAWLSMGTSQDYVVAVEEGATHVRLGRILYADVESET